MLLEAAVVFILLPADVTRVPEIVCGDGKTHIVTRASVTWGRGFGASSSASEMKERTSPDWPQLVTPWRTNSWGVRGLLHKETGEP